MGSGKHDDPTRVANGLPCAHTMSVDTDGAVEWLDGIDIEKAPYPKDVDWVVVNFSGGKDSAAALVWTVKTFDKKKIHVFHVDTGTEYKGMEKYVKDLCKKLGVTLHRCEAEQDLLKYLTQHKYGKTWNIQSMHCWYNGHVKIPSMKNRRKELLEKLGSNNGLIIEGSRAEESPERAKKSPLGEFKDMPGVKVYRPVFSFKEADIWKYLRKNDVEPFWAYPEGAPRFGCFACPYTGLTNIALVHNTMPEEWKRWKSLERRRGGMVLHGVKGGSRTTLEEAQVAGQSKLEASRERMQEMVYGKKAEKAADVMKTESEYLRKALGPFVHIHKGEYPTKDIDKFLISFSGGKDSTAVLIWAAKNLPKERIMVFHIDEGKNVQPGMPEYAHSVAKKYGMKMEVATVKEDLFDYMLGPKKWEPAGFWCLMNAQKAKLSREFLKTLKGQNILFIEGSRADESVRRAERGASGRLKTLPDGLKQYRPVFTWTEKDIWDYMRKNGCPPYSVYKEGSKRTGCWNCPWQPSVAVALVRKMWPNKWKRWKEVEKSMRRRGQWVLKGMRTIDHKAECGDRKLPYEKARLVALIEGTAPPNKDDFKVDKDASLIIDPFTNPCSFLFDSDFYRPLVDKGDIEEKHDCKFCDEPATKAVYYDEGFFVPTCDHHITHGRDHVSARYNDMSMTVKSLPNVVRTEREDDSAYEVKGASVNWPKNPGPVPAVVQGHFIGRAGHFDIRYKMNGFLEGWTLFTGNVDMPEIGTVDDARAVTQGYTVEHGNKFMKAIAGDSKVLGKPKKMHTPEWLEVDAHVFPAGDVGAGSQTDGVVVSLARPSVEFGVQKDDHREFFLTGDSQFVGVLHAVKRDIEGQPWLLSLSKNLLPSVLKEGSVSAISDMPPLGRSGLPRSLESAVPSEYRYWEAPTIEAALKARNELVSAKLITEDSVQLVDGEIRRVVTKTYLYEPDYGETREVDFSLVHFTDQVGKGRCMSPDGQAWALAFPAVGSGVQGYEFQQSPVEPFEALPTTLRKWGGDELVSIDNATVIDGGKMRVSELSDGVVSLECTGDVFAGLYTAKRDGNDSDLWLLEHSSISKRENAIRTGADSLDITSETVRASMEGFVALNPDMPVIATSTEDELPVEKKDRHRVADRGTMFRSHKCNYPTDYAKTKKLTGSKCGEQATKAIIWADGRAFVPVCEKHVDAGTSMLKEHNGEWAEIVGTRKLPADDAEGIEWWHRANHGKGWHKENYPSFYSGDTKKIDISKFDLEGTLPTEKIRLCKTGEERYVLGVVLEPNDGKDGTDLDPDTQQDIYSKNEVRSTEQKFMEDFQNIGLMHRTLVNGKVKILESYLAPVDFLVSPDGTAVHESELAEKNGPYRDIPRDKFEKVLKGTWLLGLRVVDDKMWSSVKQGELDGLSIGGSARRVAA